MSDEEKKAIDDLFSLTHINGYINLYDHEKATIYTSDLKRWQNGVKVLLNLIQKQQEEIEDAKEYADEVWRSNQNLKEEIENKNKVIDELVKTIEKLRETSDEDCFIPRTYRHINDCIKTTCEKCIKDYFKKKVEG